MKKKKKRNSTNSWKRFKTARNDCVEFTYEDRNYKEKITDKCKAKLFY